MAKSPIPTKPMNSSKINVPMKPGKGPKPGTLLTEAIKKKGK